jgi:hypothetical protein
VLEPHFCPKALESPPGPGCRNIWYGLEEIRLQEPPIRREEALEGISDIPGDSSLASDGCTRARVCKICPA